MKKKIAYTFLIITILQVSGYFAVARRFLIDNIIAERQLYDDIGEFQKVKVFANYDLNEKQKKNLKSIFNKKPISYNYFHVIGDIPREELHLKRELNYTINISTYIIPFSIVTVAESIAEYQIDSDTLYVWILVKWIKVKVLSTGIS